MGHRYMNIECFDWYQDLSERAQDLLIILLPFYAISAIDFEAKFINTCTSIKRATLKELCSLTGYSETPLKAGLKELKDKKVLNWESEDTVIVDRVDGKNIYRRPPVYRYLDEEKFKDIYDLNKIRGVEAKNKKLFQVLNKYLGKTFKEGN